MGEFRKHQITVTDETISPQKIYGGTKGSSMVTKLALTFINWGDFGTKTVTFFDAEGAYAGDLLLIESNDVHIVDGSHEFFIPPAALAVGGIANAVIAGWNDKGGPVSHPISIEVDDTLTPGEDPAESAQLTVLQQSINAAQSALSTAEEFVKDLQSDLAAGVYNGITPHVGENGNWFIGETDTGILARGQNGLTPTIGENGNWFIGETDTGIPATGPKGESVYLYKAYAADEQGNAFSLTAAAGLYCVGLITSITPIAELTAELFAGAWVNLRGPQGEQGPQGKSYNPRGAWVSGGSYTNSASAIDVVSHNGVSYYCKATHTGVSTTPDADSTNWGVLASAGIDNNKMLVNPSTTVIQGHTKQVTGYGSAAVPNNARGKVDAILKGNTATNAVTNGNFASGTAGWSTGGGGETLSVVANVLNVTGNGAGTSPSAYQLLSQIIGASGKKVYTKIKVRVTGSNCTNLKVYLYAAGAATQYVINVSNPVQNQWYYGTIATMSSDWVGKVPYLFIAHQYADAATANGKVAEVDGVYGVLANDLTAKYGAGNEPDAATCDKIFSNWFSGTKHAGQVRINSVGKNKLNFKQASKKIGIASGFYAPEAAQSKSIRVNNDIVLGMSGDGYITAGAVNAGTTETALRFKSPSTAAYGACIKLNPNILDIGKTFKVSLATTNTDDALWLIYCDTDGTVLSYNSIGSQTTGTFTLTRKTPMMFLAIVSNLSSQTFEITNIQIEETVATPYVPYCERIVYSLAAPGKSVPSAADEENQLTKKKTQKVGEYNPQASSVTYAYTSATYGVVCYQLALPADMKLPTNSVDGATYIAGLTEVAYMTDVPASYIGTSYNTNINNRFYFYFANGTTLAQAQAYITSLKIYYQLATPIITDIQVIGDLEVYPNGTFYTEPTLAGRTNTAVTVITDAARPIKSIRKVHRYDYAAGDIVMTDVTANASITGSNTSITIASFDPTKWYFYDCEVDGQYDTNPQIVLNCEVDGGIVTHDYGATATAKVMTDNESKASYFVLTNAGGAANLVMVPQDGVPKTVKNGTGQTITVKTASSTGVAIENGFTATVVYNSSDYVIVKRHGDTGWVAPTLLNGASGALYYRKNQANRLEFKGNITCATAASASFTLSASFYPVDHAYINVLSDDNTAGKIVLFNSGTFYIVSAGLVGKKINMDNISIPLG